MEAELWPEMLRVPAHLFSQGFSSSSDVKEQPLYSELPPNDWASRPIYGCAQPPGREN